MSFGLWSLLHQIIHGFIRLFMARMFWVKFPAADLLNIAVFGFFLRSVVVSFAVLWLFTVYSIYQHVHDGNGCWTVWTRQQRRFDLHAACIVLFETVEISPKSWPRWNLHRVWVWWDVLWDAPTTVGIGMKVYSVLNSVRLLWPYLSMNN